ncbi:MAG: hypothetical protein JWN34_5806 [Bryobacterales bacterium]|nr:hypothetical protein [Bryobacterales bacterium]
MICSVVFANATPCRGTHSLASNSVAKQFEKGLIDPGMIITREGESMDAVVNQLQIRG